MNLIMRVRNIIQCLLFVSLTIVPLLVTSPAVGSNGDFSLHLTLNRDDISEIETIVVDPEGELTIEIQISDVTSDVTLKNVLVVLTFAEQIILIRNETLGNYRVMAGEIYRRDITINAAEILTFGGRPLATGIYRSQIRLEYATAGQEKAWNQWKNIKILGNPLNTPLGAVGIVVSAAALVSILMLARSLAVPKLPIGTNLPLSVSVKALPRLYEFASERLEPVTRGRVVGSIVKSAKRRITKERCPICGTRLKHGQCFTCKKSGTVPLPSPPIF